MLKCWPNSLLHIVYVSSTIVPSSWTSSINLGSIYNLFFCYMEYAKRFMVGDHEEDNGSNLDDLDVEDDIEI